MEIALRQANLQLKCGVAGVAHHHVIPRRRGLTFGGIFDIIHNTKMKNPDAMILPIIIGTTDDKEIVYADLADLGNLLLCGVTGSGKSMWLHAFICHFMRNYTPEQVKFVLSDTKQVEFHPYWNSPLLACPVGTTAEDFAAALQWVEQELEKRQAAECPMTSPRIVIVVDEFSDLMIENEEHPLGLAQKLERLLPIAGRYGIHFVLATSRTAKEVLTSNILAAAPARIAFKLLPESSERLIGTSAAAELKGRGDLLYRAPDSTQIRAQGPYVSDEDIANLLAQ